MAIRIIDENFKEITPELSKEITPYGCHILPRLFYLDLKRDVTILWCESLKDHVNLPPDHPSWQPLINIDKINASDADLVLILWCDHPWLRTGEWIEEINKINKPCVFLSWAEIMPGVKYSIHFPFYSIAYPMGWSVRIPSIDIVTNPSRKYIFSSITARHQYDRIVNLTAMLMNDNLFNPYHSIINFPETSHHTFGYAADEDIVNNLKVNWPEAAEFFKNHVRGKLPIQHPEMTNVDFFNPDHHDKTMSAMVPAYTDAYVNIIAETSDMSPFLSEKSMKPILAGQLFVTIAPPGTLDVLRRIGFDTFDDIFEHDRYSEYPDVNHQVRALHARLARIGHNNWEQIYVDTADRRLQNRNYLLSGQLARHKYEQLAEMINSFI